jgi:hypothetical protein
MLQGVVFGKPKAARGESPSIAKSKPVTGRERLHFFDNELAKAADAVTDLEKRVATLEGIAIDAIAAEKQLQAFIAQDGGTDALLIHSSGNSKPDDPVAKLIAAAKASAEAAAPATIALPIAQDALARAKTEVARLGEEKNAEIGRYLTTLADSTARKYKAAFELCCSLHDEIMGFADGTSQYMGQIALVVEELRLPRFNLPSLACLNEHDPFLRHRANSHAVAASSKTWSAVKARLVLDVDADLSDLIKGTK